MSVGASVHELIRKAGLSLGYEGLPGTVKTAISTSSRRSSPRQDVNNVHGHFT